MTIFSCFRAKPEGCKPGQPPPQGLKGSQRLEREEARSIEAASNVCAAPTTTRTPCCGDLDVLDERKRPWVNDALISLTQLLPTLDGGWWSALSEACQATCEHLGADHASVYVLSSTDLWATVAACTGLGQEAMAGRAYSCDPRFNGSAASTLLRASKVECPELLICRSVRPAAPPGSNGKAAARAACSGGECCTAPDELPGDWQVLYEDHGCRHFAAVGFAAASGELVGVLSVAAKGASRPASWTPEALHTVVGLLAGPIRKGQAVLASPALSQLHSAGTFSDLVQAAAEAAVEVASSVTYVKGSSRVAVIHSDVNSAAIFSLQPPVGERTASQKQLLKAARSSCEYVQLPHSSLRKSVTQGAGRRSSMDVAQGAMAERASTLPQDNLRRESWTPLQLSMLTTLNNTNYTTNNTTGTNISFTFPFGPKGGSCKGHTLSLDKTLLGEALSKQVAGLCIDDCQAHTVSTKAYPRDLLLSRGAVMPLSLALATISCEERPLLGLYVTFDTTLPRPMLQAVVQELGQLLQAVLPTLRAKLSGVIQPEYDYLTRQLEDFASRRATASRASKAGPPNCAPSGGHEGVGLDHQGGSSSRTRSGTAVGTAAGGGAISPTPGSLARDASTESDQGTGSQGPDGRRVLSFILQQTGAPQSPGPRPPPPPLRQQHQGEVPHCNATPGSLPASVAPPPLPSPNHYPPRSISAVDGACHSPIPAVAKASDPAGLVQPTLLLQRASLCEGSTLTQGSVQHYSSQLADGGEGAVAAAARAEGELEGDFDLHLAERARRDGDEMERGAKGLVAALGSAGGRAHSACEGGGCTNRRLLNSLSSMRSVSFHLEKAQAPRGASKLAPIIASMHNRLRAAQAVQMTFSRSESRKADLQSVKLLQEIGQGGYGTVYRGTYHGAEVAIKVIKQSRLTGVHSSSNALVSSSTTTLGLHKQNLHDAIELVASVSMSHINIVQVPAYFMDVRLEKPPEDFNPLDSVDMPTESRPFRLRHSPSLLESPAPGQEQHGAAGEGAMALVLEFCDCGSLCDAIMSRKFIEKVTPKTGPLAAASGGTKTYLAINMRSVYSTLLEVALALRHMHSLALVHCDLKPQNVLLKSSPRDPRGFTAKLSDFGLAKMMAHDDQGQLVIDEAVASGTITHVAPEVFLGQKALGAAVDIYAFGILMFQVLCGMKVYDKNMSPSGIANAVAHRHMRPQMPSWVPANYRSLAEACWESSPADRPTADELVSSLERALEAKKAVSKQAQPQPPPQQQTPQPQQQQQQQHRQQQYPPPQFPRPPSTLRE